jgi:hypothetical protein
MSDIVERLIGIIDNLRMNKHKGIISPHKLIFLLTLLRLYEIDLKRENKFPLDEQLELLFYREWKRYFDTDPGYNSIEYPYYHLQMDGLWRLREKCNNLEQDDIVSDAPAHRMTKKRLIENFEYGYFENEFSECLRNKDSLISIIQHIEDTVDQIRNQSELVNLFERITVNENPNGELNSFVSYLNSLQCSTPGNENALAEFQACSPYFSGIHVAHPLVNAILNKLRDPEKSHILLTGHAGDGKSTIALEVFKKLNNLPADHVLATPLKPREDITLPTGRVVSIIKDLSEWGDENKRNLFFEILNKNASFLVVSNTGTLLNTFTDYATSRLNILKSVIEPELLEAIDSTNPYDLDFGRNKFSVFNLALQDNLAIAKNILVRMLDSTLWIVCEKFECHHQCPVYRNISLIRQYQERFLERALLAYRRMYEYGTRLTLRQLTAHMAYFLTAGLDCNEIHKLGARPDKPLVSEFLFYNRFFGDNGKSPEFSALQLQAIQKTRQQGFGEQPCATWERRLWLITHAQSFTLGIPSLEEEFDRLRRYGSGELSAEDVSLSADQAREQVRRILYFLYEFSPQDDSFIRHFLGSPAIMKWWKWQEPDFHLSLTESSQYKQRIFHILQEQFTGIRLPENPGSDRTLYITLSRQKRDIRQSAQIVLAQIDFESSFSLVLADQVNYWGEKRRDLSLMGQGKYAGLNISLTLPYLDYILMRQRGESGEILQTAYAARLEQLKSQLLQTRDKTQNEDVLLVRLRSDHTFTRQVYSIRKNKLEVA